MTRGAPGAWSPLQLPVRVLRVAPTVTCPMCQDDVATRAGFIVGHYGLDGHTLCSASSKPIPGDPKEPAA